MDTDQIQKAIEKITDEEAQNLAPVAPPSKKREAASLPETDADTQEAVSAWFFTFMCMNIPIAGWIYLFYLAFRKPNSQRRNFARAYLFYKLIFLLISALILGILIWVGLDLFDQLLAYMEML